MPRLDCLLNETTTGLLAIFALTTSPEPMAFDVTPGERWRAGRVETTISAALAWRQ
jgi:hypothetical protein